jgi:hypothetical protein
MSCIDKIINKIKNMNLNIFGKKNNQIFNNSDKYEILGS